MGGEEGKLKEKGGKRRNRRVEVVVVFVVVVVGNGNKNCGVFVCARVNIVYIHLCGWMDDFPHVWAQKLNRNDSKHARLFLIYNPL